MYMYINVYVYMVQFYATNHPILTIKPSLSSLSLSLSPFSLPLCLSLVQNIFEKYVENIVEINFNAAGFDV